MIEAIVTLPLVDAPVIETARLRLRAVETRDVVNLEALLTDPAVMYHYRDAARCGIGERWLRGIARATAAHGFAPFTVELLDGTFVGQCGPLPLTVDGVPEIEIICFFARPFWRGRWPRRRHSPRSIGHSKSSEPRA